MTYRELLQFEPITDVKVLTDANAVDQAREDVRTFVVSHAMSEALGKVLIPSLRFDLPGDHKGMFVVATYGTGKTHLMSVVSAVAEHAELVNELSHADLKAAMEVVAGRFKVVRAEIGAVRMSLRDIVFMYLERHLEGLGVSYKFKTADEVPNNKELLVEMMQAFEKVYPDQGLLLVLDELLDYLRGRRDQELTLDLAFLREVGEICRPTRFRFIAGIQESLFDNPRFANAADAVVRVRERFDQLRISRDDVSFVVQERLLKKSVVQRDIIRQHLQPFTPAFEGMAEHLDDFVNLFPVHPAYLRTFERVTFVEKRKVLSALSDAMAALLESELPADEPGLICYDSYHTQLAQDPSNRMITEVKEVLERAATLRSRIERALPTKAYIPTALRIIDALAVHRLTTSDIYTPIGATLEELRDDLCLLPDGVPERDATFIKITVESVVTEIIRAVSGQFITENADNGQVYLDVRKDIDYDQKIDQRAQSLDDFELDDAYFKALEEVLEQRDAPYVSGYRIWQYELPWAEKSVGRTGYLFMGAPNERSTAQPPRDFYVYFLQPYEPPAFVDAHRPDEVFFRLDAPDDGFKAALLRYAGADALAGDSTATHRSVYADKRDKARGEMVAWLKKNMATAVSVTHAGVSKPVGAWLPGAGEGPRRSVKELVDAIAAAALRSHFEVRYPGYPQFAVNVTRANLADTVRQALSQVATGRATSAGQRGLTSLGLVDPSGGLSVGGSYASDLLAALAAKNGKALNRAELLAERDPGVPTWGTWHLEPAWLVVVAAVCCQLGRLEIGFPDGQVDAGSLDRLTRMNLDELDAISHLAPPRPTPVAVLREVAVILGLGTHAVPDAGVDAALVRQIHTAVNALIDKVVGARSLVSQGLELWGAQVLDRQIERDARIEALQRLLNDIHARDSVGKLNKINTSPEALLAARAGLGELRWLEAAQAAHARLSPTSGYLRQAVDVFADADGLSSDADHLRREMLGLFTSEDPVDLGKVSRVALDAEDLRQRYADDAARAHGRDRLDAQGDERKRQIIEGDVFKDLKMLTAVEILPDGVFGAMEMQLVNIGSCKTFEESKLRTNIICPDCGYRPHAATGPTAKARLEDLYTKLVELRKKWEETLVDSLRTPEIGEQIRLLSESERVAVSALVHDGTLPSPIPEVLVRGINQALKRFRVRKISSAEMWNAVFPAAQPSTLGELQQRFNAFLQQIQGGDDPERVRVLPGEGGS